MQSMNRNRNIEKPITGNRLDGGCNTAARSEYGALNQLSQIFMFAKS